MVVKDITKTVKLCDTCVEKKNKKKTKVTATCESCGRNLCYDHTEVYILFPPNFNGYGDNYPKLTCDLCGFKLEKLMKKLEDELLEWFTNNTLKSFNGFKNKRKT